MTFRLSAYLDRLGLTDIAPGVAGLRAVQEAQMRAIVFENLDPLLGRVPDLSPPALFDKLVHQRRGGYCFEQNGLLAQALEAAGFAVTPLLARVRNGAPMGGARTHQALRVEAEGARWLVDAGFGGHGPLWPLRLDTDEEQAAPNGRYRLSRDAGTGELLVERQAGAEWISLYGLDGAPVQPIDFHASNFLCARWEGAPFIANLMMALHRPEGRVAVFNRAVSLGLPPETERRDIDSRNTLGLLLAETFGLDLGAQEVATIWERIAAQP